MSREVSIDTDTSSSALPRLVAQRDEKRRQLATLQESKASYEKRLDEVNSEIVALNEKAGLGRLVPQFFGGAPDDPQIESLRESRDHLQGQIEEVTQRIATTRNEFECIDRKMEGKGCDSFLERLTGVSKTGIESIAKIADTASNLVVLIANVLIAVFVKNILVPILFLFIALKCGAYIVKRAIGLKLDLHNNLVEPRAEMRQIERNTGE